MSDQQDDRYLRYCIARLSAFRNVWWSLANEFDFMSNLDGKHPGRKTMDDWDRFFAILQQEDPMVIEAGWEVFALDQVLRMDDMAFTIKQRGKPAVTIPAWSTLVKQ